MRALETACLLTYPLPSLRPRTSLTNGEGEGGSAVESVVEEERGGEREPDEVEMVGVKKGERVRAVGRA